VPDTEREWLAAAKGQTVRQLEELIAGKLPGDSPADRDRPEAKRHVLRFEVSAETLALFREAVQATRRSTGAASDDDTLLAMARHVLGGPTDEGRSGHQIAFSVCTECGKGHQLSRGELVPVSDEIVEMASCDAQRIQCAPSGAANTNAVAPQTESAHVGATHPPPTRASQTIPPATRRAVLIRDQRHCRVPGCRHATFLDVHHIVPRSQGGRNEADNLLTLCGAHHRAVHCGHLRIAKAENGAIAFSHGDGSAYGLVATRPPADVYAKVLAALSGLGFRKADAQRAVSDLSHARDAGAASCERLLREALQRLTRPRA
jgi:hypothetical protein